MSVSAIAGGSTPAAVPENPIDYPIIFTRQQQDEDVNSDDHSTVTLFTSLQWLLPVFQLADWLPKHIGRDMKSREASTVQNDTNTNSNNNNNNNNNNNKGAMYTVEVRKTLELLPHFESFFTSESKVIPNGALLYTVQTFRFPTPRGPRTITRALVETPGKYFSPLQEEKGGGHFLCCYEDRELLRCFTYLQLDQLRFAWVAVKELVEEHKAVQRTDGSLTGLARRDIKKNNTNDINNSSNNDNDNNNVGSSMAGTTTTNTNNMNNMNNNNNNTTSDRSTVLAPQRPQRGSNIITGPTAEARKVRAELREKKYMSELLREECAARWPHTPVHKSVIISIVEERLLTTTSGGRNNNNNNNNNNKKGPRMYGATVELPLLNKKGPVAAFKAPQWCTTRRDAENAAAELALRALRAVKS